MSLTFQFVVRVFPLDISDIQEAVAETLEMAMKCHADQHPEFCLPQLRLSDSKMEVIRIHDHLNV